MAYDEGLAQRVRDVLAERADLAEKRMFGGIAFIVQGNMACGVRDDGLIVRVGAADYERVVVVPEGYESDDDLRVWVEQGLDFALTLPPK
jgi:TfoX/Sxy family transcriptional regulator of competence genes